ALYACCAGSTFTETQPVTPPLPVNPAFALRYILRLSSCRLMEGFITPPLPHFAVEEIKLSMAPSLQRHYSPSSLLRATPPSCCLQPLSRVSSYGADPSPEISLWGIRDFSSFCRLPVTVSPLIPRRCALSPKPV